MVKKCEFCGKDIENDETICVSCISFIEWKYGSLEDYYKKHSKEENK